MKILIVEDEPRIAELLADSVRSQGHDATLALTVPDALRLLTEFSPDVVFLDLVMPAPGGLAVMRRIREARPGLPVIVVTGHAFSPEVEQARALGAVDVIEKPAILKNLNVTLERLKDRGR